FDVILSTNGTPLTPERIDKIARLNLYHIQMSFAGHDAASYETTYVGARFDRVAENIRQMKAALVAHSCTTEFLVNGVVYGDEAEVERSVQFVMSLGVERKEIMLARPNNFGGHRYETEALVGDGDAPLTFKQGFLKEPPVLCSVLLNSPAVLVDGRVTAC